MIGQNGRQQQMWNIRKLCKRVSNFQWITFLAEIMQRKAFFALHFYILIGYSVTVISKLALKSIWIKKYASTSPYVYWQNFVMLFRRTYVLSQWLSRLGLLPSFFFLFVQKSPTNSEKSWIFDAGYRSDKFWGSMLRNWETLSIPDCGGEFKVSAWSQPFTPTIHERMAQNRDRLRHHLLTGRRCTSSTIQYPHTVKTQYWATN